MSWPLIIMSLRSKPLEEVRFSSIRLRSLQAARRKPGSLLSWGAASMSLRSKLLNSIYRP